MDKRKISIPKSIFRIIRLIITTILIIILLRIFRNFIPFINIDNSSILIPGLILSVLVCTVLFDKVRLSNLGLAFTSKSIFTFIYGLIIASVSVIAIAAYAFFQNIQGTELLITPKWFNADNLSLLVFYLMVAFGEELFFRGYIISTLRSSGLKVFAVLMSSFIFMLIHLVNSETTLLTLIGTFMAGLLLAILYVKFNNLWVCIGFHLAWNFLQDSVIHVPTKGTEVISIVVLAFMTLLASLSFKSSESFETKTT
ncbi:MAG TPA: CPBP family intramembrane glutamic endopeptidase [Pseudobacteroides sp.]|uniref:CPBP family intramembrane glutamic endopeptidase n=1 Tax=Pseudobacteroides sp. TaxID=1968840 RepID=UPI002F95F043